MAKAVDRGLVMEPRLRTWLPLRQELNLFPGPNDHHGAPTWVVQDPASQRFFRFDWPSLEMLRRWHLADPKAIADSICEETTLHVSDADVENFSSRLHAWELVQVSQVAERQHWKKRFEKRQGWRWLLNNYLYMRIPLLRPQKWLDQWQPRLSFLFKKPFWLLTLFAGLLGAYLTAQQWTRFSSTFSAYSDLSGALYLLIALAVVKCFHELGHAITAHHYGCRVPSMGVVLLVMWPVLFTDTTEAWTLRSRKQRLAVGAAGMIAEGMTACWALLAWHLVAEGPLKTAFFFLSTSAVLMSLAFNLNPMMRFDGYFLISDFFDQPNLHSRSFQMARWWLRKHLWGLNEPVPEIVSERTQRAMIGFAWFVWVYRLVVFMGIALMVYHYFFKTLGIFLMAVEVGVFIVKPLIEEIGHWWKKRDEMHSGQRLRNMGIIAAIVLLLLFPWSSTLRLPAIYGSAAEREIQLSEAAQLDQLMVRNGERVKAGDTIAKFVSPELENQLKNVLLERETLVWQLQHQGLDSELLAQGKSLTRRYEENLAQEINLKNQLAKLTLKAPIDGRIEGIISGLNPGVWLPKGSSLMWVLSPEEKSIQAWISEQDVARIDVSIPARFIPELSATKSINCAIQRVDQAGTPVLNEPAVSTEFGGALPVRRVKDDLVPVGAWYKVQLESCPSLELNNKVRGTLLVSAQPQSIALGLLRRAWSVLLMESGQGY